MSFVSHQSSSQSQPMIEINLLVILSVIVKLLWLQGIFLPDLQCQSWWSSVSGAQCTSPAASLCPCTPWILVGFLVLKDNTELLGKWCCYLSATLSGAPPIGVFTLLLIPPPGLSMVTVKLKISIMFDDNAWQYHSAFAFCIFWNTLELEPCWVRALVSLQADLDLDSFDLLENCLCKQVQEKVPGLDPHQCLPLWYKVAGPQAASYQRDHQGALS